jgi:hypothetical protein
MRVNRVPAFQTRHTCLLIDSETNARLHARVDLTLSSFKGLKTWADII